MNYIMKMYYMSVVEVVACLLIGSLFCRLLLMYLLLVDLRIKMLARMVMEPVIIN